MDKSTHEAWVIVAKGLDNLKLIDERIPQPIGYEIQIRILAAGLNPVDWKRCEWDFAGFPGHVGLDGFGIVTDKGSNVTEDFIIDKTYVQFLGDYFKTDTGSYSFYTVIDSRYVSIIKDSLLKSVAIDKLASDLTSLISTGWTSWNIVFNKLKLYPGAKLKIPVRNIVVTAGSGGVGVTTIQLLNLYRQTLEDPNSLNIITTCSARNNDYVKSFGATHTIDYHDPNIEEQIKAIVGARGVDIWIDIVDAKSTQLGYKLLGFGGQLVVVVDNIPYDGTDLFQRALTIHNIPIGLVFKTEDPEQIKVLRQIGDEFQELYEKGLVKPLAYETIAFEDVKEYLTKYRDGKIHKKVIMRL